MNLKESIRRILKEEIKKTEWEYQVRDIGCSDVYYKKKRGDKLWLFTTELDYYKNK